MYLVRRAFQYITFSLQNLLQYGNTSGSTVRYNEDLTSVASYEGDDNNQELATWQKNSAIKKKDSKIPDRLRRSKCWPAASHTSSEGSATSDDTMISEPDESTSEDETFNKQTGRSTSDGGTASEETMSSEPESTLEEENINTQHNRCHKIELSIERNNNMTACAACKLLSRNSE